MRAPSAITAGFLAVLVASCSQPAPPPEAPPPLVEARAGVDRAVATTGDVITFAVEVEHDAGIAVEVPEPGAEIAGLRVIDMGRDPPVRRRDRVLVRRWYQLRADLVGSYVLPPVRVSYVPPPGAQTPSAAPGNPAEAEAGAGDAPAPAPSTGRVTLETSEIFLEVKSVLPPGGEVGDIRDIKPLQPTRFGPPPWAVAAAAAALLAALGAGVWLWRRRCRLVVVPPAPPHEVAFAALDALRQTDFSDPKAVERYYFGISAALRAYVESRYGLNATDLTTEEILPRLVQLAGVAPQQRAMLGDFLLATDRVKFAGHRPSTAQIEQVYEQALTFVEGTTPAPELEPASSQTAMTEAA